MAKIREAVGDIDCPLCRRAAELHASEEKQKLDPDSAEGGRPAYPKKHYIVCPPVKGYRGCGTILANAPGAQGMMMELGTMFGAAGKVRPAVSKPVSDEKPAAAEPVAPAPSTAAPPPTPAPQNDNPWKLW